MPLESNSTFEEPEVVPPAAETTRVLVLLGASGGDDDLARRVGLTDGQRIRAIGHHEAVFGGHLAGGVDAEVVVHAARESDVGCSG